MPIILHSYLQYYTGGNRFGYSDGGRYYPENDSDGYNNLISSDAFFALNTSDRGVEHSVVNNHVTYFAGDLYLTGYDPQLQREVSYCTTGDAAFTASWQQPLISSGNTILSLLQINAKSSGS